MGGVFSSGSDMDQELLDRIHKDTGFSESHIKRLHARFQRLDKDKKGYLVRGDFVTISEVNTNPVGDRIVDSFFKEKRFPDGRLDIDSSERVYFYDFASNFAVFRPVTSKTKRNNDPNSKEHKLRFLFNLVDSKQMGFFSRDELHGLLESMLGATVNNEQLDFIVDRMVIEADTNGDGYINYDEFVAMFEKIDIETRFNFVGFK